MARGLDPPHTQLGCPRSGTNPPLSPARGVVERRRASRLFSSDEPESCRSRRLCHLGSRLRRSGARGRRRVGHVCRDGDDVVLRLRQYRHGGVAVLHRRRAAGHDLRRWNDRERTVGALRRRPAGRSGQRDRVRAAVAQRRAGARAPVVRRDPERAQRLRRAVPARRQLDRCPTVHESPGRDRGRTLHRRVPDGDRAADVELVATALVDGATIVSTSKKLAVRAR